MEKTPRSMRLAVALFGRTNSGKSTLLNRIAGQIVAITSPEPGTTTDAVEKTMELWPLGPILLIDTAGLDDPTRLGRERVAAARRIYDRADVVLLVTSPGVWGDPEAEILAAAAERKIKVVPAISRTDCEPPTDEFIALLTEKTGFAPIFSTPDREQLLTELKTALIAACPEDFVEPPPLLGDLARPGEAVVLLVPIDKQAPKGRLILPQAQAIRDALDHGIIPLVCRDTEYQATLALLKNPPALVVCDSQIVHFMVAETPESIPCTTFSILFSRLKGDLEKYAEGAKQVQQLRPGDRVLIAEGCTHHDTEDDIGRVKIPRWLEKKAGGKLDFTICTGRDYPADLSTYKLVIHCGGCMLNRRETLRRIALANAAGVPITNYGMTISACQGVFDRVMAPLPR